MMPKQKKHTIFKYTMVTFLLLTVLEENNSLHAPKTIASIKRIRGITRSSCIKEKLCAFQRFFSSLLCKCSLDSDIAPGVVRMVMFQGNRCKILGSYSY